MKKVTSSQNIKKYLDYFLMLCILTGIILHIVPYFYNRSMWIDEAMLASSICTRNFWSLAASPLDWGQSSSVGWLFIVKIITLMFGTSETALRIWSLITSFGCITLVYLLLRNNVKKSYALLITSIFSLTDRYIYYGNEVKPYMSDNLCCLLTLYVWQKYKKKKITLWKMALIFSVLIWFSFSAVFFIAACMIIECFGIFKTWLKNRDNGCVVKIGICAVVLVSFVLNYVSWLSQTSDNAGGAGYWALLKFPLIPTSFSDIKLIIKMAKQFLNFYGFYYTAVVFIVFFLIYLGICVKEKNDKSNLVIPFILSLFLLLTASYCGFYPIQDRLVQIYAIVMMIIMGYACNEIELLHFFKKISININREKIVYCGILASCLVLTGMDGCKNLFAGHVYKPGSEITKSMEYLDENLTNKDIVYVFEASIPVYTYEMGYQITYSDLKKLPSDTVNEITHELSALPYKVDNTIYGQALTTYYYQTPYSYEYENNQAAIQEDAELIMENQSVYIFTSHGEAGIPDLMKILKRSGTVETVVDFYDTRLYHFVKNN